MLPSGRVFRKTKRGTSKLEFDMLQGVDTKIFFVLLKFPLFFVAVKFYLPKSTDLEDFEILKDQEVPAAVYLKLKQTFYLLRKGL